ncbi:hypothetical protein AB7X27_20820 [Providencia rettgeri]
MKTEKEEATLLPSQIYTVKYLIEFYSKKTENEEEEIERTKRSLKLKPTTKIKRKI